MRNRYHLLAVAILPILGGLTPTPARADVFGCTVLLCMANPAGWASVPACIQPVQTAMNLRARRQPWPQCPEAAAGPQRAPTEPGTPANPAAAATAAGEAPR